MICENIKCKKEHEGSYGTGRFCSKGCSISHGNSNRKKEDLLRIGKKSGEKNTLNKIEVEKKCKKCENKFKVVRTISKNGIENISKREREHCSRSCANGHFFTKEQNKSKGRSGKNNKNYKGDDKHFCLECNKAIRKTKSGYCKKHLYLSKDFRNNLSLAVRKSVKEGRHNGWESRNIKSYPEIFFTKVLKNNNLFENCIQEYRIKKKDLGLNCNANYFLDFYFPEKKIDLEIDGKQHKYRDRLESDKIRDKALINNGYKVYRIDWKNPINEENKAYIKLEIEKFLSFYNENDAGWTGVGPSSVS